MMLAMILVLAAILTIIADPYKPQFRHYADHFTVFLLFIACASVSFEELGNNYYLSYLIYAAACFAGTIHQVYFLVLVIYWFKKK